MASKFHESLSQDLSIMLNDSDDHNIIIQAGENANIKEFRAHTNVLRARSPYFKSALSAKWVTKKNNMFEFKKPNVNPIVFDMILKYLYTGEVDLTKKSGIVILGLLVASDELLLEELFKYVQDHLIEKQTAWVRQNFVLVLHTVFKLDSCKKLQDHCLNSICADPQPFITSKDFPSLDKDIFYGLLKRADLQIEEAVAWDCLIKWGIKQTPNLGSKNNDRAKWNDKDYEELKNTLSRFIPLIRFPDISSDDFFDKVRPYKPIIPPHIYEEAMEFYLKDTLPKTPPRFFKCQIESNIINPRFAYVIANWIDKKDGKAARNKSNLKYKFNLVYRASRNEINSNNFNNFCSGQARYLVLVMDQSSKIYGGYSPIGFNVSSRYNYCANWRPTTDSFIFSCEKNEGNFKKMKLSRVTNSSYAIYDYYNNYGFNFGNSFYMSGQNVYLQYQGYYDDNVISSETNINFVPKEIELFNVA
ncbi:15313_t:CDS:2 [Funneliformis geosporum]|uniref:2588_t:CDS:1 n=1 Tax=Funneliformis geosporum TaxID=1117311 RepID=A0A9W4SI17_9GLOM|nr:2588_t:CDS:2 [Funneliformis geosporum]CAI2170551.1 15313_t:CDS:2 [Funneliformis geosporum]